MCLQACACSPNSTNTLARQQPVALVTQPRGEQQMRGPLQQPGSKAQFAVDAEARVIGSAHQDSLAFAIGSNGGRRNHSEVCRCFCLRRCRSAGAACRPAR